MNSLVKISIVMALLSAIILIAFPNIWKYNLTLINKLFNTWTQLTQTDGNQLNGQNSCLSSGERLFTVAELSRYDGSPDSLGLYLSFLGVVYDVSKGAQHYKPGESYSMFAGKDATKAFITGDFSREGLVDDLRGLDSDSFDGIQTWIDLYENDYQRVGKLIAAYYDSNGCETEALVWVQKQMQKNDQLKEEENEESKIFPYCNSEWSAESGGRVWCSEASGGSHRNWAGVPRQLFVPHNKQYRCACVRNTGPPTVPAILYDDDKSDYNDRNLGDLENPRLKEYEGCDPQSIECIIKQ